MFSSGMRETFEGCVRIPDVSYAAFRALLSYLLTDELPHESQELPIPVRRRRRGRTCTRRRHSLTAPAETAFAHASAEPAPAHATATPRHSSARP
eukprot:1342352-Prymnesium_polylepis.5